MSNENPQGVQVLSQHAVDNGEYPTGVSKHTLLLAKYPEIAG
jgi:hypothetical protein